MLPLALFLLLVAGLGLALVLQDKEELAQHPQLPKESTLEQQPSAEEGQAQAPEPESGDTAAAPSAAPSGESSTAEQPATQTTVDASEARQSGKANEPGQPDASGQSGQEVAAAADETGIKTAAMDAAPPAQGDTGEALPEAGVDTSAEDIGAQRDIRTMSSEEAAAQDDGTEETASAVSKGETLTEEKGGIPSLVWLYYAKDPGKDERYKQLLEEAGYSNVVAKGEWATKYPVNYIFYRPKDKEGLQRLASAMDELDFKVFHHLDSATSPRLRGYFADTPELEFLLILQ